MAARRAGAALCAVHLQAIEAALCARGPRTVALPNGLECVVRYGRFAFGKARPRTSQSFCYLISGEGRYVFEEAEVEVRWARPGEPKRPGELRLDAEATSLPLQLRSRRPGNRFRPRGAGEKKLKALLIDAKVPRGDRDRVPLLCDASGNILHVPGLRPSQAAADGESANRQMGVWVSPVSSADVPKRLQKAWKARRSLGQGGQGRIVRPPAPALRGAK